MVKYKGRQLRLSQRIFDECMKLHPVDERTMDTYWITNKKRIVKLLKPEDSQSDLFWLIWQRIFEE